MISKTVQYYIIPYRVKVFQKKYADFNHTLGRKICEFELHIGAKKVRFLSTHWVKNVRI